MAVREIVQYPDPVLRQKAEPVERFDAALQRLIDDMFDTLYSVPGVGLAAPQIGVSLRVFVYDLGVRTPQRDPHVLINPEIRELGGPQLAEEEGCLSVADYREIVRRAGRVRIRGLDREGREVEYTGEGLQARLYQHEVDHLNGMLLVDRLSSLKRDIFQRKFKKRIRSGA